MTQLHRTLAAGFIASLAASLAACSGGLRSVEAYRADTTKLLATRSAELRHCYSDALRADGKAAGTVTVQFAIEKDTGTISRPTRRSGPVDRTAGARPVRREGDRRPGARPAGPQGRPGDLRLRVPAGAGHLRPPAWGLRRAATVLRHRGYAVTWMPGGPVHPPRPIWSIVAGLLAAPTVGSAQPGLAYQLTHAVTVDPSPSPDGQRMVYITVVAGREQLFVSNIDGSKPVQVTRDDFDHEDPAWSPDGTKIAFVSMKDGLERIAIMDPDGSHVDVLTPASVRAIHPNWAPDSVRIAYSTDDDLQPPRKNESEIDVVDRKTRRITRLISGGINTYPAWSPDGKKLAFRRMLGALDSEVFIANADGSDAHDLTNHPAFDGWPAWSPDGSRIAFASNRRSNYQIYVMKPDGSDVTLVASTEGRATAPVWARDGAKIYFPICRNVDLGHDCQIFVAPAPHAS